MDKRTLPRSQPCRRPGRATWAPNCRSERRLYVQHRLPGRQCSACWGLRSVWTRVRWRNADIMLGEASVCVVVCSLYFIEAVERRPSRGWNGYGHAHSTVAECNGRSSGLRYLNACSSGCRENPACGLTSSLLVDNELIGPGPIRGILRRRQGAHEDQRRRSQDRQREGVRMHGLSTGRHVSSARACPCVLCPYLALRAAAADSPAAGSRLLCAQAVALCLPAN